MSCLFILLFCVIISFTKESLLTSQSLLTCDKTVCNELGGHCLGNIEDPCACLGVINCSIPITDCSCSTENNPCYNGTCIDTDSVNGTYCNCTAGWSGKYCDQDALVCTNQTCNNGVCIEELGFDFHCDCYETYRGEFCNETFCPDSYCQNNGTCEVELNSVNHSIAMCHCPMGYYGVQCDNKVEICDEKNCLSHGGGCSDDENGDCICFGVLNCSTPITNCNMSHPYVACGYGECIDNGDNLINCSCSHLNGITGDHCQKDVTFCDSLGGDSYCKSNGKCIDGFGDHYYCNCNDYFKGDKCQETYCPEGHCLNGGTCVTTGLGIECNCDDGFTGSQCENDPPVCSDGLCENGGTCVDGYGLSYICNCTAEYTGDNCEDPVTCDHNPCMNNGTCANTSPNTYNCNCTPGYEGKNCELDENVCLVNNPCLNNGTCIDGPGLEYSCECAEGYTGHNCSEDENYCHHLNSSLCSGCSEAIGNTVFCESCQRICDCKYCACRLDYCGVNNVTNGDEELTCVHLIRQYDMYVTIYCNCTTADVVPSITSHSPPETSSYSVTLSTNLVPSSSLIIQSSQKISSGSSMSSPFTSFTGGSLLISSPVNSHNKPSTTLSSSLLNNSPTTTTDIPSAGDSLTTDIPSAGDSPTSGIPSAGDLSTTDIPSGISTQLPISDSLVTSSSHTTDDLPSTRHSPTNSISLTNDLPVSHLRTSTFPTSDSPSSSPPVLLNTSDNSPNRDSPASNSSYVSVVPTRDPDPSVPPTTRYPPTSGRQFSIGIIISVGVLLLVLIAPLTLVIHKFWRCKPNSIHTSNTTRMTSQYGV